jgi:hypothetical protein
VAGTFALRQKVQEKKGKEREKKGDIVLYQKCRMSPFSSPLAVPNAEFARLGVHHPTVSAAQQTLYRAFAQTGSVLTWEAVQRIETQALARGGMSAAQASATVEQAIQALKNAGVSGPTRIPWGG